MGGLTVREVTLRDFRSYARLELTLEPGVVLVTGPNGAGKTNLLEALHLGTQGFSPRARSDAQLVRFGEDGGPRALTRDTAQRPFESEVALPRAHAAPRARLNGGALGSAEQLRFWWSARRRAPTARSDGSTRAGRRSSRYATAVGQRNAALRQAALPEHRLPKPVAPWSEQVVLLGAALVEARQETLALLAPSEGGRPTRPRRRLLAC